MPKRFSWRENLRVVLSWLAPRRRLQILLLVALATLGAVAELATLGALLPFLALLTDPDVIPSNATVNRALGWIGVVDPADTVILLTLVFGSVVLIAAAIRVVLTWASSRFMMGIGHELAVRVYEQMLYRPYKYHVDHNASEVLAGVGKVGAVVGGVMIPALDIFVASITALAILAGIFLIDWAVALLAFGLFGSIYWAVSARSQELLVRNSMVISRSLSDRTKVMQEGLGGIRDVILDGSQQIHVNRFRGYDGAANRAQAVNNLWGQVPRYLIEALGTMVIAGIAVFIAQRDGGLGNAIPVLGALTIGAQRLLPLFQRVYVGWNQITGHQGFVLDVAALAGNAPLLGATIRADASRLKFNDALRLHEVGFRYKQEARWLFRRFNLEIKKGARVGFAGRTGCGKSTLLDIVMGLLPAVEGSISVDGTVLTGDNLRHWQARIAHVPQSIFLADSSLAANIAFGETPEHIDMSRVEVAARRARMHEFVEALPDRYQTTVGERGVRLSGGQRQRVGIARALYRNADVLILDEATSALDGETEASVMDGISELGPEVTVLIVAHRLSTLDGCDFVVRLDATAGPDISEGSLRESALNGD